MRKVKDAVDLATSEKIYFKGHAKATYLSDGRDVEEAITNVKPIVTLNWDTLTYEDVVNAYNSGKHIVCVRGTSGYIYDLTRLADNEAVFSSFRDGAMYTLIMKNNNSGISSSIVPTTAVSDNPSNSCFPTEKAMCEYVQQEIENVSGESSVFEAEYNKTTFAEIVEAYNAGKSVTCRYGQTIAQLISITDSVIYFTSINIKKEVRFICFSSNLWNYNDHNTGHELKTLDNGNAEITIAGKTAEVATPQYVENLLGTLINGDY